MSILSQRQRENAEYAGEMLRQLHSMLKAAQLPVAAYLVDMAYIEVKDALAGTRSTQAVSDRGRSVQ